MGGVDATVRWMGVDGDADMGIGRIHDVCPVSGAGHEGARQCGNRLTAPDVLADLGPAARCAAHYVASVGQEAAVCHL